MEDNKYYILNSEKDINFQYILNDFIENFTQKKLVLNVTYGKIDKLEIRFDKFNLPHLLGLHKVINGRATNILQNILEGKVAIENIKLHERYKEIKDRILSYNFLHSCFINKNIKLCIIINSHGRNPQNLDIVFIDRYSGKDILLGLRKVRNKNYYSPTTMYVVKDNSDYMGRKKARISSIEWESY